MIDDMPSSEETPFEDVVAALLNPDASLSPLYLYRLSDIFGEELAQLIEIWPEIPSWRRQAMLEDMEQMFQGDYLLNFELVCRLGLEDSNQVIRFLALRALQEYEVEDLIPVYLDLLQNDDNEDLRAVAAVSLGKFVYQGEIEKIPPEILDTIAEKLLLASRKAETTLVRRRALESLGFSSHPEVPNLIAAAFAKSATNWKASALLAMGRSCDQIWQPEIVAMLDADQEEIRFEAVRAAGELGISESKPRLLELLDDEDGLIRTAAVWSLSQIGGEGLQNVFDNLLNDIEDDDEAENIEVALDNLIFNESIGLYDDLDLDDDNDDEI
jgi:hypothetical protein